MESDLISIREEPSLDFSPAVEVVGVLCECEGKFLFLRRGATIRHPLVWNIPGGKVDPGEGRLAAAVREMWEEAGLILDREQLVEVGTLYIRRDWIDYPFHLYHTELAEQPQLRLHAVECSDSCWVSLGEAEELSLISGGLETLKFLRQRLGANTPRSAPAPDHL